MFDNIKRYINTFKIISDIQTNKNWEDAFRKATETNLLKYAINGSVVEPQRDSVIIYTCLKIISETFAGAPMLLLNNDKKVLNNNDRVKMFLKKLDYSFWARVALLFSLRGEVFLYIDQSIGSKSGTSLPYNLVPLDGKYGKRSFK